LEKDRNRRYETANGLALDVRRYLADEPVQAGPPSAWYRFRKLARRNRAALTTAALVAAALVLGTAVSTWQAVRATRAEGLAAQRLTAESEAQHEAERRLYDALFAQARASRQGGQDGQRLGSWKTVVEAARLGHELGLGEEYLLELRNEAIACLALADVRLVKEWEGLPPGTMDNPTFDADLGLYARSDRPGNVSIRRVADDQELGRLRECGRSGAEWMGFSPDGNLLAVSYWGNHLRLWDWRRGEVVFEPTLSPTTSLAFSPDGRRFALGWTDGTLTVHDTATRNEETKVSLGVRPSNLNYSPDGQRIAVVSFAGRLVQVLDAATGDRLDQFPTPDGGLNVAWHPDGALRRWGATTGTSTSGTRGRGGSTPSCAAIRCHQTSWALRRAATSWSVRPGIGRPGSGTSGPGGNWFASPASRGA
jgi:hypothetical protein